MITREKLQIYEQFGGDIDGWAHASKIDLRHSTSLKLREPSIADQDWHLIHEILQSLVIVERELASPEFETQARARALDSAEDHHVYQLLLELARSTK